MGLLQSIREGTCGVRLKFPNGVEVMADEDRKATIHDRARGVVLFFERFEKRLDLRHPQLLRQDIERHARDLFETCFRLEPPQPGADDPTRVSAPRTQDPGWSPVIDVAQVRAGNGDALTVIHRLWYQPGREEIIGHLLIPLARGLFEVRIVPKPMAMTGVRESALTLLALNEAPNESEQSVIRRLGQAELDDPRHDAEFPDHPLSSTRRILGWLLESAAIEVLHPQGNLPEGEEEVPRAGIAITPPPRYLLMEPEGPETAVARWSRLSFAGTDGVQLLSVGKLIRPLTPADPRSLRARAEELVRAGLPQGATDVQMKTSARPEYGGRLYAETYLAYVEAGSRRHTSFRWVAENDGRAAMVALGTPQCVPVEELKADTQAVVDSLRFLPVGLTGRAPPPRRPSRRRT
jgi:hypothetical protein